MARKHHNVSRRDFTKSAVATAGALSMITARPARAAAGKTSYKVGLIGCGGRGNGALDQHVKAAEILNKALDLGLKIEVVATADWYKDRAERTGKKHGTPKARCFGGADAYKKLVEVDGLDTVLMATPPAFRPPHLEASIKAGKHVFMEKPAAVDPPGCRRVIAAGEMAKSKNLMVIAGTQRRHQKGYMETQAAVAEGALGRILGGRVSWCGGHLGSTKPFGEMKADTLPGGWVNWREMSGDHIVEQHVHNLDIMNWFMGGPPTKATGFGFRARRPAGNQYDFFSVDFEFTKGVRIHSTCRQISGCANWVGEHLVGEKGNTQCFGGLTPSRPVVPKEIPQEGGGHQQEHINMLYYLVKGKIMNEARNVATSTATAIMGRMAAYTGQQIAWKDLMEDSTSKPDVYNFRFKPAAEDFETGNPELPTEGVVALPGKKA